MDESKNRGAVSCLLYPTLVVQKTDYTTNKPIANATFRIDYENPNGGVETVGTYRTDEKGRIVLPYVEPGWYLITETIPAQGYQLPTNPTTRIYLKPGTNSYTDFEQGDIGGNPGHDDYEVTNGGDYPVVDGVVNYPLNSVVIKKADANTGEMLSGATFELIRVTGETSGQNGTLIGTFTTDSSGVIVITGLEAGAYAVRETKSPPNYIIAETDLQTINLKADGTSVVEAVFRNYPYGAISIDKTDGSTGLPLAGAEFRITTAKGEVVGTANGKFVTDASGTIIIPNLPKGAYVATEMKSPEGYILSDQTQTIEIDYAKVYSLDFYNERESGVQIVKIDADTK